MSWGDLIFSMRKRDEASENRSQKEPHDGNRWMTRRTLTHSTLFDLHSYLSYQLAPKGEINNYQSRSLLEQIKHSYYPPANLNRKRERVATLLCTKIFWLHQNLLLSVLPPYSTRPSPSWSTLDVVSVRNHCRQDCHTIALQLATSGPPHRLPHRRPRQP